MSEEKVAVRPPSVKGTRPEYVMVSIQRTVRYVISTSRFVRWGLVSADDAGQETWVASLQVLPKWEPDRSSLATYLRVVVPRAVSRSLARMASAVSLSSRDSLMFTSNMVSVTSPGEVVDERTTERRLSEAAFDRQCEVLECLRSPTRDSASPTYDRDRKREWRKRQRVLASLAPLQKELQT